MTKNRTQCIYFRQKVRVAKTIKVTESVLADFDKRNRIIGMEILDASSQISKKQILSTIKTAGRFACRNY
jgi:uncharacterized protein YuzE